MAMTMVAPEAEVGVSGDWVSLTIGMDLHRDCSQSDSLTAEPDLGRGQNAGH